MPKISIIDLNNEKIDCEKDRDAEINKFLDDSHNLINGSNKFTKKKSNNNNMDFKITLFYHSLILLFIITLIIRLLYFDKYPTSIIVRLNLNKCEDNFTSNNFSYILPRINLSDSRIPEKTEIFKSRILYINEQNVSKEYINYIRPIDEKEEEKYKVELFPSEVPNITFDMNRSNLLSLKLFVELCSKELLINSEDLVASDNPLISLIVPSFNKKDELMKSIRSIQNQSFKNIEIIIIDDCSTDDTKKLYEILLKSDPRVRIFYHLKNMGVFRTRIDGFLYSRGKYILHFDPGDLYSDNLILEDAYDIVTKYNLDSVRFSFKMIEVKENGEFIVYKKEYPLKFLRLEYGPVYHNVHVLGYGTIWDRITRANVFTKGLCLFDEIILNCYKNMWEDMWWNQLTNFVSYNHLVVNRIGYMYYSSASGEGNVKLLNDKEKNRTIKEFILFWLFDLELLPKEDNKKDIIGKLRRFNMINNQFHGAEVHLDYLNAKFYIYEILLDRLINDPYVDSQDRDFVSLLKSNYLIKFNNNFN